MTRVPINANYMNYVEVAPVVSLIVYITLAKAKYCFPYPSTKHPFPIPWPVALSVVQVVMGKCHENVW